MAGGAPRHHGLGMQGGGFAWSAGDRGPEGLPCLTLTAPQWCGYYGGPRRRAAAAATTRSGTGRRLRLLQKRRIHAEIPACQPHLAHARES
jgi:hypothetical protein